MSHISCPHCGFQNFSISAYCGRCERPLRPAAAAPTRPEVRAREPAPAPPAVAKEGRPPVSSRVFEAQLPPPRRSATPEISPLHVVPPPAPPAKPPFKAPARPIEMRDAILAEVRSSAGSAQGGAPSAPALEISPNLVAEGESHFADPAHEEPTDVPVALATGRQLFVARMVDVGLIAGVGLFVTLVESFLTGGSTHIRVVGILDWVAQWIDAHSVAAHHGLWTSLLLGLAYNVLTGLRGGRTAGRILVGTVLVRVDGEPMTVLVILRRTAAQLLSCIAGGAGFFWSWVDRQHRTWHDLYAGTVIVQRYASLPEPQEVL
jgi:uncharacterized RDD family membrane protein YckC